MGKLGGGLSPCFNTFFYFIHVASTEDDDLGKTPFSRAAVNASSLVSETLLISMSPKRRSHHPFLYIYVFNLKVDQNQNVCPHGSENQ